jgi:hypothetical protein
MDRVRRFLITTPPNTEKSAQQAFTLVAGHAGRVRLGQPLRKGRLILEGHQRSAACCPQHDEMSANPHAETERRWTLRFGNHRHAAKIEDPEIAALTRPLGELAHDWHGELHQPAGRGMPVRHFEELHREVIEPRRPLAMDIAALLQHGEGAKDLACRAPDLGPDLVLRQPLAPARQQFEDVERLLQRRHRIFGRIEFFGHNLV